MYGKEYIEWLEGRDNLVRMWVYAASKYNSGRGFRLTLPQWRLLADMALNHNH